MSALIEWLQSQVTQYIDFIIRWSTGNIVDLILKLFPDASMIFFYANELITQFFIPGTQFIKMIFKNICGINGNILTALFFVFILRVSIWFGLRFYRFCINLWSFIQTGRAGR